MPIHQYCFQSQSTESYWIAQDIAQRLEENPTGTIVVIGRKHAHLTELVPYLQALSVSYSYDHSVDVLQQKCVHQLVTLLRFIDAAATKSEAREDLLPEILRYPFWNIPANEIWKIALEASKLESKSWVEYILSSAGEQFISRPVIHFLLEASKAAAFESVEKILDMCMGVTELLISDTGESEFEDTVIEIPTTTYKSPFKSYYFPSSQVSQEAGVSYLQHLSSLQTFFQAVRSHIRKHTVFTKDVVGFLDTIQAHHIPIRDISRLGGSEYRVQLMTAHKAKGLEFDTVYVIRASRDQWLKNGLGIKLGFPMNLPLLPEKDTVEDHLRLLFVALTRAKDNLIITFSQVNSSGKALEPIEYFPDQWEQVSVTEDLEVIQSLAATSIAPTTFDIGQKTILDGHLDDYKLSVTHFLNYLNVATAGPLVCLEYNLLRFPAAKNIFARYGTAIHSVLCLLLQHIRSENSYPDFEWLKETIHKCLKTQHLTKDEYLKLEQQALEELPRFYEAKKQDLLPSARTEVDFTHQAVFVGNAHITGKIDRLDIQGNSVIVVDYKTGKPLIHWSKSGNDGLKSWKYETQLIFYKLLLKNSRNYSSYHFQAGQLEFIQPLRDDKRTIITLQKQVTFEEEDTIARLIQIVYEHIRNHDFPDVSRYSQDLKGTHEFISDLLSGKV